MNRFLKPSLDWLHQFRLWLIAELYRWRALIIAIITVLVALFVALQPGIGERLVRVLGLLLQLIGIGTVGWGVSNTKSQFGHPTLIAKAGTSLRNFPPLRRSPIVGTAALTADAFLCADRVRVRVGVGPNPTLEARIEVLEKNLSSVDDELTQTREHLEAEQRSLDDALHKGTQARAVGDETLRRLLESAATGGLHITEAGVVLLFSGVVLSTLPAEIAGLLK